MGAERVEKKTATGAPASQSSQQAPLAKASGKLQRVVDAAAATTGPAERLDGKIQRKENNTGLPDNLKAGIENLSGMSMDDVKVHYNSNKPAQLNAHAFAQGNQVHLGPGAEQHLNHEAWHVVQQKQGRVVPTEQL